MTEIKISLPCWFFEVDGKDKILNNVVFSSDKYVTFEECFRNCINFNPYKHWPNLYEEHTIVTYIDKNNISHKTTYENGLIFYDDIEDDLGITEEQFDKIIELEEVKEY